MGGQEHFYLEPQSTLIWSVDGGNEVHMISSTQVSNSHFLRLVLNFEVTLTSCRHCKLNFICAGSSEAPEICFSCSWSSYVKSCL